MMRTSESEHYCSDIRRRATLSHADPATDLAASFEYAILSECLQICVPRTRIVGRRIVVHEQNVIGHSLSSPSRDPNNAAASGEIIDRVLYESESCVVQWMRQQNVAVMEALRTVRGPKSGYTLLKVRRSVRSTFICGNNSSRARPMELRLHAYARRAQRRRRLVGNAVAPSMTQITTRIQHNPLRTTHRQ
jgi:hypothetical protein